MDIFFTKQYSGDFIEHKPETFSSSEASSCSHGHADVDEEEQVILASSRPKKRAGRRKFKETRHPVYRGVRRRNNNKWVCELRVPNNNKSRIWVGTYATAEMAARAHDVAALALRGKSACLNFADSAWRLPVPVSTDALEIRRVAAMATKAFGFGEETPNSVESLMKSEAVEACSSDRQDLLDRRGSYLDDDAEFDLQSLLLNMAEGPLLSLPPSPSTRVGVIGWNDLEIDTEVSLWSFSN
ncbi:Dehydration-responsive element binding factor [Quillaja saponaria]|uniref:Dehydration-responsive element binding factor n=1 Tax=Quillaja saponaria TaxID=32244 RepID=A0AAD7PEY0_QUISA|nr:Dehydration-responsive element binding factor [Quillaja saponaria]